MVYSKIIKYLFKKRLFYEILENYMFTHHPDCNPYSSHVWTIGHWKFCKSCSTGFIMLNLLFLIFFINISLTKLFSNMVVDFTFIVILLPFSLLYLLDSFGNKFVHSIVRIMFPLFAITLFISFIFITNPFVKILLLGWILIGIVLMFKRRKTKMMKICTDCEYKADFDHCPGFEKLRTLADNIRTDVLIPLELVN